MRGRPSSPAGLLPGDGVAAAGRPGLNGGRAGADRKGEALMTVNLVKAGFTFLVAVYGIICADAGAGHLIDGANLVIHEAGHLLFGYMGQTTGVLGGTIAQLLIPLAFTVYFFRQGSRHSASVTLFWSGQNLFNISVYIKDAPLMELPLLSIGGGEAIHDWNFLLLKAGILASAQTMGNLAYCLGAVTVTASVVLGFIFSIEREPAAKEEDRTLPDRY